MELSIIKVSDVKLVVKYSLKWSLKLYSNVLKDCPPLLHYYYMFFAGKYKYIKKWSCRGQERGFFHSQYSNRTNYGGKKWGKHYGIKVGNSGEGIVCCLTRD